MTLHCWWFRLMTAALLVTLVVVVATPARAEALEPFMIIGIVTAGIAVLVLIVYLIVASSSDSRSAAATEGRWMACNPSAPAPSECWPITTPAAELAAVAAPIQAR